MAPKAVAKSTTRTTAERIRDLDTVEVTVPVL